MEKMRARLDQRERESSLGRLEDQKEDKAKELQSNWRKDFHNILLLLLLYTLQGVPMGLSPAIKLVFACLLYTSPSPRD